MSKMYLLHSMSQMVQQISADDECGQQVHHLLAERVRHVLLLCSITMIILVMILERK
jgi:hypothetical protein